MHLNSTEFVEPFLTFEMNDFQLDSQSFVSIPVAISIPEDMNRGVYAGEIYVWVGGEKRGVPLMIEIVEELRVMIYSAIDIIEDDLFIGDNLQLRVRIFNIGTSRPRSVVINYTVRPQNNNTPAFSHSEEKDVELLAFSYDTNVNPGFLAPGNYLLEVSVNTENYTDSSFSTFSVQTHNIMTLEIFGFKLYQILIVAFVVVAMGFIFTKSGFFFYGKYKQRQKAKLKYTQELVSLPIKGERSITVGKVAETKKEAYLNMDELTKHILISGGTGSGKTIAGMVMAEEVLMKGGAVVVFDPTLQWTGFFKEQKDEGMKAMLKTYNKKPSSFNTELIAVRSADQEVAIDLSPGTINVLALNNLSAKDLDKFVDNFIKDILEGSWDESSKLKYLMIFDEVHRLLPRYGGTRKGIISIERAVREFRKWGFGVVMISQVMTDFSYGVFRDIPICFLDLLQDRYQIATVAGEMLYNSLYLTNHYKGPIKKVMKNHYMIAGVF